MFDYKTLFRSFSNGRHGVELTLNKMQRRREKNPRSQREINDRRSSTPVLTYWHWCITDIQYRYPNTGICLG